jgi:hypothetical protein
MAGEDSSAELVGFALPNNAHTRPFEAEIEAADS